MTHKSLSIQAYKKLEYFEMVLTWLERPLIIQGGSLRVEQAICTTGVCNTLLFPDMGKPNSEISVSRECVTTLPAFL